MNSLRMKLAVCVQEISGSAINFVTLYVDDILLIGIDVGLLSTMKA